MSPGRIVVVGDVVTDVLALLAGPVQPGSDTPAQIRLTGGGQAANTAAWLAAEDTPVTLVATVGDDPAGRSRVAELAGEGVTCAVRACAGLVTGTIVVLATDGDRAMINDRGANLALTPADVDAALTGAPDAVHLHLSGYPLFARQSRDAARRALAAARERGLTTSVDAASAVPLRELGGSLFLDFVRDTDLLLANLDEAVALVGPAEPDEAARALAGTARAAVVKLGPDGAVWADRDGIVTHAPADVVQVVDATGAGDAFAAGLLAARIRGADPATALRAGARLGASAVTRPGARPAGYQPVAEPSDR